MFKKPTYSELQRRVAELEVQLQLLAEITYCKRAEEEVQRLLSAVQEEKESLSCLLNSISDEVWFADTNRKFTLANPSAVQEFRLSSPDQTDVERLAASLEVLLYARKVDWMLKDRRC
jgi:PAS domain-containing protein